ncbi:MAG: hypothetical protein J6J44_00780 [Lachnospiraceae bacterium]|nr:hypothetical protein [Lachnospiraceae bacterium]
MYNDEFKAMVPYLELYKFLGQEPRTKDQIATFVVEVMHKAKSTGSVYSNDIFAGKMPYVIITDDKASIDIWKYREFVEKTAALIGEDCYKMFTGPAPAPRGKNAESDVGKLTTTESPIVQDLNRKLKDAKSKLSQMKKEMTALEEKHKQEMEELRAALEKELADACLRFMDITSERILSEMDSKVLVIPSIHSVPKDALIMDCFLDDPARTLDVPELLSKYGGQKDSIYEVVAGEEKKLDIATHIRNTGRALFGTDIFKRRVADESRLRLVDAGTVSEEKMRYLKRRKMTGKEIYENRLRTINNVLTNPALSNQQKLAFYAGWSEYKGTDFAECLELAGDLGLEAGYVITLLENPGEHENYHNVRGFLLQALKSSEARIKREAVRELICGEWYVEAEYGGKVCRFQMMPVDELVAFKEALENLQIDEAIRRAHNLIGVERVAVFEDNDVAKKMFVDRKKSQREINKEREQTAVERIHQINADSGVDVHSPITEEFDDGFENMEGADGTGEK